MGQLLNIELKVNIKFKYEKYIIYSHIPLIHSKLLKQRGMQVFSAEVLQLAPFDSTIPLQYAFKQKIQLFNKNYILKIKLYV
jgi:hypothetical protein